MQEPQLTTVDMPLKAAVVQTPPRNRRVLWDQFHSIKYPPAYLPRDNLDVKTDILDWHGDHLLTNYHTLYTFLRENGMFVEILSSPYTCFNASQYAVLIVADSEEEFYEEEITKLSEVCAHAVAMWQLSDYMYWHLVLSFSVRISALNVTSGPCLHLLCNLEIRATFCTSVLSKLEQKANILHVHRKEGTLCAVGSKHPCLLKFMH